MSVLNFNANDHEPEKEFTLLPPGEYIAAIVKSEIKNTKRGDGEYLSLTIQVLDGDFKNRLLFDNLNIINPNKTAQNIAEARLSAICHATNVLNIEDSSKLHNRPFKMIVGKKMDNYKGEDINIIKKYFAIQNSDGKVTNKDTFLTPDEKQVLQPPPWVTDQEDTKTDDIPF